MSRRNAANRQLELEAVPEQQVQSIADSLAPAINQLSDATLSSQMLQVAVPEFNGTSQEDVHDWIDRFETSTFSLPASRKTMLLALAFKGPARAWFSRQVRPLLATATWNKLKKLIVERFSTQHPADKHLERLSKLKYDVHGNGSIQSFFDEFIYLYGKAHPTPRGETKAYEKEMTRARILAIPAETRSQLDLLADLTNMDSVEQLRATIKRYDNHVRIDKPKPQQGLDEGKFKEILTTVVKDMMGEQNKTIAALVDQTAVVAAFAQKNEGARHEMHPARRDSSSRNSRGRFRYRSNSYPLVEKRSRIEPAQQNNRLLPPANPQEVEQQRQPPYPCVKCGGNHWHSQCQRSNLNE